MRNNGSLVFRKRNELLYTNTIGMNQAFYIVLYGSFSLTRDRKPFGAECTNGFTIGEEVLFEPTMSKRMEKVRANQNSCCLRIDLEKFRNMSQDNYKFK